MNYYIITGTSSGIGEAIARKLLMPGNTIFATSRSMNTDLVELANSLELPLFYHQTDLSLGEKAESFIREVFNKIDLNLSDRIALINNAGMLEPMAQLETIDRALLETHFHLNILAPMILSSAFIAATQSLPVPKIILNISSGAAFTPISGWSAYCTSKSALDMFTRVVGLEQSTAINPVKIFALAPGIIETNMQRQIREKDRRLFPEKDTFVKLYEQGRLVKPDKVAQIIVNKLFDEKIENGAVITIEQLKSME